MTSEVIISVNIKDNLRYVTMKQSENSEFIDTFRAYK